VYRRIVQDNNRDNNRFSHSIVCPRMSCIVVDRNISNIDHDRTLLFQNYVIVREHSAKYELKREQKKNHLITARKQAAACRQRKTHNAYN